MPQLVRPLSWGPNITVNGNPHGENKPAGTALKKEQARVRHYQNDVFGVLQHLAMMRKQNSGKVGVVGPELLMAIRAQAQRLSIVPYLDCQWEARTTAHNERRATARGNQYRNGRGVVTGTGGPSANGPTVGSNAVIRYTPDSFRRAHCYRSRDPQHRLRPDCVLVHELVHALRMMAGRMLHNTLPAEMNFGNVEEFFAVLIANIYRSECERPEALRNDHSGHFVPLTQTDALVYYNSHATLIDQLCNDLPDFTRQISYVDCEFNPIRFAYSQRYFSSAPAAGPRVA
jgi:hypothetical protein